MGGRVVGDPGGKGGVVDVMKAGSAGGTEMC